jgi:predicted transcriptional regulator
MVRVTFTVDEDTLNVLKRLSARFNKAQSVIFREAIRDYSERADQLSAAERDRMLNVLDRIRARKPTRTNAEVDAELADVRAARKTGGRRTRVQ